MNGIEIKTYKVDYDFLINNYLDPKVWDLSYTIFNYKKVSVDIALDSINTKEKELVFRLKSKFSRKYSNGQEFNDSREGTVAYKLNNPEYTIKMFQNKVNSTLTSVVRGSVYDITFGETYSAYYTQINDERNMLRNYFNEVYLPEIPDVLHKYTTDMRNEFVSDNEKIYTIFSTKHDGLNEDMFDNDYNIMLQLMFEELKSTVTNGEVIYSINTEDGEKYIKDLKNDIEELDTDDLVEKYSLLVPDFAQ